VFELVNQSGPTLSTTTLQIKNATCGNRNGAITGIRIMNATGTQYIRWIDTAGTTVGTSLDLINIGSGKYRLKYKDAAACDTIVTSYFVVGNDGAINIDTTSIVIKASKCSSPTGSISNLIVYGAESYTWYNASGNQIVSQTVALSTAPSGSYSLTASNSIGCSVTSPVFVIPQTVFSPVTIRSIDSSHAFCDLNNGYIKPNFLTDTSKHSFKWTNLGLGITVSQNSFANQLATGIYSLVAIDTNYCSGEVYRTELKQIGKPDFDYSVMKIADDTCDLGVGQILNIGVTGGAGDYRWAWSKNNITITGNGNSLSKLNNGVYVAKVKDRNGCEVSSNIINIYNKKASLPIPVTDDYFILRNSQAKIDIRNFAAGNYLLFLERTSTMPIATTSTAVITTPPVLADKLYYLQYQKGSCLSDLKPIEVKVFDNSEIRLPNAFSPNNDGINDYWIPEMRGIINKIELRVYNRYGQQIFFTRNVKQGWDGKVDSKLVPMGTYYWLLSAFDHLSKPIYSSGSVTVLR
jgi:gliding motility-associated-like protein